MAVDTVTNVLNTDNPSFQAWTQAIHDVLVAGGWVQTTDAGQIDLTSEPAPGGANTSVGYEIWRSDDATVDLVEIYIRIEYGSGNAGASSPAIWLTAGFASDGAGNLTGAVTTETRARTGLPPTSGESMNISAGPGYLVIALMSPSAGTAGMLLSVERTRGVDLAFINNVHLFSYNSYDAAEFSQCVSPTRAYTNQGGQDQAIMANVSTTPSSGQAALGLIFGMTVGPTSPSINLLGCEASSLGLAGDEMTVTLYGEEHTFKIQSGGPSSAYHIFPVSSAIYLTRYE